jgi:hypothetical protein
MIKRAPKGGGRARRAIRPIRQAKPILQIFLPFAL